MKIITKRQIREIRGLYQTEEDFKKYNDKNNPLYENYKDHQIDEAMERGSNGAVRSILRILGENDLLV